MLSLISPAKRQDFSQKAPTEITSNVLFGEQITKLINKLKHYIPHEFEKLMGISPKLAKGVFNMYVNFDSKHYNKSNAKQALFAFAGDVYMGLDAMSLSKEQINYGQHHLLIISGLYGLIRPLDLIQAYRLEMGTKFYIDNLLLYNFWQVTLTRKLNEIIKSDKHQEIINLASNEYSKSIDKKMIKATWLEVYFKEFHKGKYQTIAIFSKHARGRMMRYIINHKIDNIEGLKGFNYDGYEFNSDFSSEILFCFTRVRK